MIDDPPPRLRCRQIVEQDLAAVVPLLMRGFPRRPESYWREGLRRQAGRHLPPDVPRYGLVLESDGCAVGVILLIYSNVCVDGHARLRCNMSSWYVEPGFRTHATMMVRLAMRSKSTTFLNISAAPHTVRTIQTYGFRRYASGVFVGLPWLKRGVTGSKVHAVDAASAGRPFMRLPEGDLLLDHAAMGCTSLVVEAADGLHPFVFQPFYIRSGLVKPPMRQLLYCRELGDYLRFAGVLGRYLLWRGTACVVHDANGPAAGLAGHFFAGVGQKFYRGPDAPRLGDLAYTERLIFGP